MKRFLLTLAAMIGMTGAWAQATDEEVAVTKSANNEWTLTMPEANVWVKDAGTLAAGKCWIELPASPAHARRLAIVHEGTTTCIAGVSGKTADHSDWYDLSGRRVMQSTKGLYIIGGKKDVVK